jgi:hypothetical protein
MIPLGGFSEHTKRRARDLHGNDKGPWRRDEDYRIFVDTLRSNLQLARVDELAMHVNDAAFADACVNAFVEVGQDVMRKHPTPRACSTFGSTMLGHIDRTPKTPANLESWNAAHMSRSCAQPDPVATGGNGLFYCL